MRCFVDKYLVGSKQTLNGHGHPLSAYTLSPNLNYMLKKSKLPKIQCCINSIPCHTHNFHVLF